MRHLLLMFVTLAAMCGTATAQTVTTGSFKYDPAAPDLLVLAGPIDRGAVADFRRALRAHPADVLILNAPGGNVAVALELSAIVRDRDMATVVPQGASCASACAFVFVAGKHRRVYGRLGVHQFRSVSGEAAGSESAAQSVTAEIIDYLKEYKVSPQFLVRMLETAPDAMYWFPKAELRRHGIETLSTFPDELALYDAVPALSVPIVPAPVATPEPERPVAASPAPERPIAKAPAQLPPSFDCTKAGNRTETAICATPEIATLDNRMAGLYYARRASMSGSARETLTQSQRNWLARRNGCGSDVACLGIVYRSRIAELGG